MPDDWRTAGRGSSQFFIWERVPASVAPMPPEEASAALDWPQGWIRCAWSAVPGEPAAMGKREIAPLAGERVRLRLLEAADLNEAIQLAAKIPPARVGTIEVRPVRQLAA